MAFNPAPTALIAGWSEDGTDVTFPLASVPGLTAANSDAVTGDWRDILLFLVEQAFNHYNGLATADRPTKVTISRQRVDRQSAVRYQYNLAIESDVTLGEVVAE